MDKGSQAEIKLADILAFPLLTDFVMLNPQCKEGKKYRELCDLLIEMNQLTIAIELKVQDKSKAKKGRDEQKWAKKKISEASNQINGALRSIEENNIKALHPFRGEMFFESKILKPKFGIVIVDYNLEPFKLPKELRRRSKMNNIPIHYFSYNDFIVLCQKLMTLPDLIDYLDRRSKIPSWSTPFFNDEKNLYAYYLVNPNKITYDIQRDDFKNYWQMLENEYVETYNQKVLEDEKVEVYNEMVNILCTVNPITIGNEPSYANTINNLNDPDRLAVTRTLNSVNRMHRREFVHKMFEKIERADLKNSGFSYFAYRSEDDSVFFLFLASKNDRPRRKEELELLAHCLNCIVEVKKIIGIASESKSIIGGRSYDFIYLEDFPRDYGDEFIEQAKGYFKDIKVDVKYDFPSQSRFSI